MNNNWKDVKITLMGREIEFNPTEIDYIKTVSISLTNKDILSLVKHANKISKPAIKKARLPRRIKKSLKKEGYKIIWLLYTCPTTCFVYSYQ